MTGLGFLLWLGLEARARVPMCKEGLVLFDFSIGAKGGSIQASH